MLASVNEVVFKFYFCTSRNHSVKAIAQNLKPITEHVIHPISRKTVSYLPIARGEKYLKDLEICYCYDL